MISFFVALYLSIGVFWQMNATLNAWTFVSEMMTKALAEAAPPSRAHALRGLFLMWLGFIVGFFIHALIWPMHVFSSGDDKSEENDDGHG